MLKNFCFKPIKKSRLKTGGDGEACDKLADEIDDVDLYDDMIGADDMEELFGDSDEDDK